MSPTGFCTFHFVLFLYVLFFFSFYYVSFLFSLFCFRFLRFVFLRFLSLLFSLFSFRFFFLFVSFRFSKFFFTFLSLQVSQTKSLTTRTTLLLYFWRNFYADSSRAPGLTSGLQGSVNVHRRALLLVPQWQCISSFVFYIVIICVTFYRYICVLDIYDQSGWFAFFGFY